MRPVLDHLFRTRQSSQASSDGGPMYGVLSEWSFGHFIQYHGGWPAVVDNFGDHAGDIDVPRNILLVPYPTDTRPGASRLQSCEVLFHDVRYTVDRISEEAVATGAIVQLRHRF